MGTLERRGRMGKWNMRVNAWGLNVRAREKWACSDEENGQEYFLVEQSLSSDTTCKVASLKYYHNR